MSNTKKTIENKLYKQVKELYDTDPIFREICEESSK